MPPNTQQPTIPAVPDRSRPWTLVAAVSSVLLVTLPWFLAPGYLFFTDFVWGPRPKTDWHWNGGVFRWAVRVLGYAVTQPVAQKLAVFGILLLVFWAGVTLARALVRDERVVALTGLFFLFNPFTYDRLGYGQIYVLLGLALLTLGIAELLSHLLRDTRPWRIALAGLWFGLAIQFLPNTVFFAALLGVAWIVAEIARDRRRMKSLALPVLAAAAAVILVNLNWLVGAGDTAAKAAQFAAESEFDAFRTSGKNGATALMNVIMMSGFWGKDQRRYLDLTGFKQNWGRSFLLLLPLMALGIREGLKDRRRQALAAGLVVAGVMAVTLAVGVRLPLTRTLTFWLAAHLPFYGGMRETQKWVTVVVIVYGVLLAWGTEKLLRLKFSQLHGQAVTAFIAAVMLMQASSMAWGMNGAVRAHEIPADWAEAETLTAQPRCQGSVVWLPWHLYMGYKWAQAIIASPAAEYFSCPVISGTNMEWRGISDDSGNPQSAAISAWIDAKGKGDSLHSGIPDAAFVVLAKDADWQKYTWIDNAQGLRLVKDFPTLRIYAIEK